MPKGKGGKVPLLDCGDLSHQLQGALEQIFARFDVDRDGALNEAELQSFQLGRGPRHGGGKPTLRGKARYWNMLLESASVLHCFPPEPRQPKEEKRVIFMGHPAHTSSEIAFERRQGLWRVASEGTGQCVR